MQELSMMFYFFQIHFNLYATVTECNISIFSSNLTGDNHSEEFKSNRTLSNILIVFSSLFGLSHYYSFYYHLLNLVSHLVLEQLELT